MHGSLFAAAFSEVLQTTLAGPSLPPGSRLRDAGHPKEAARMDVAINVQTAAPGKICNRQCGRGGDQRWSQGPGDPLFSLWLNPV